VKCFTEAAGKGIIQAQYNLGICYASGEGTDKDLTEAVVCFTEAAKQGHVQAQYNLGVVYDEMGNEEKAVEWLEKAKEQKFDRATDYLTQRTARKKFEELIENQQTTFKDEIKVQNTKFEEKIEEQASKFQQFIKDQNEQFKADKLKLVEDAKKEIEKNSNNQALWFSGVLLFIFSMLLYCLFFWCDQYTKGINAQFEAQKTVVEMQLKNYEAKANQPLHSPKKP
jgi:tetratricopeptide (TPR) repeat protein